MVATELPTFFKTQLATAQAKYVSSLPPLLVQWEREYPWQVGGLDWSRLPASAHLIPEYFPGEEINSPSFLYRHCERVKQFVASLHPALDVNSQETLLVTGDMSEGCFIMNADVFFRSLSTIFNPPESVYVIPPDCRWCLGFRFEMDVYFGLHPRSNIMQGRKKKWKKGQAIG